MRPLLDIIVAAIAGTVMFMVYCTIALILVPFIWLGIIFKR